MFGGLQSWSGGVRGSSLVLYGAYKRIQPCRNRNYPVPMCAKDPETRELLEVLSEPKFNHGQHTPPYS